MVDDYVEMFEAAQTQLGQGQANFVPTRVTYGDSMKRKLYLYYLVMREGWAIATQRIQQYDMAAAGIPESNVTVNHVHKHIRSGGYHRNYDNGGRQPYGRGRSRGGQSRGGGRGRYN